MGNSATIKRTRLGLDTGARPLGIAKARDFHTVEILPALREHVVIL